MTVFVVEILCIDGGGFEGVFSTHEKAQAWIDAQPKNKFKGWQVVPMELDVPTVDPLVKFRENKRAAEARGHEFTGFPNHPHCKYCERTMKGIVEMGAQSPLCGKKLETLE